jgi:hypothetical protein
VATTTRLSKSDPFGKGEGKKQKNNKTKPPIVQEDSMAEKLEAITTLTGTKPKKRLEKKDKKDKTAKKERKEKSKSKYSAS